MAGGEIKALPPALAGAGATLQRVAGDLDGVAGQFNGGAVAGPGCDPAAQGAFDAMQSGWQAELDRLRGLVAGVSSALSVAAQDYMSTDSSAMPAAAPSSGASGQDALTQLLLGPLQGPGSGR